ncbi:hypothetical protein Kpol_1055p89, partial [Vanderwaltozyma polyspora DSM 70294]
MLIRGLSIGKGPLLRRFYRVSSILQNVKGDNIVSDSNLVNVGKKWENKVRDCVELKNDSSSKDIYVLSMFPYPSGTLHLGHLRVYVISDVLNRFYKLNGYNVLHPMGWDSFGLPAENAAIERRINPADWTIQNISKMKDQMKCMLANFDWDRELSTSSPEYYKFTQWIFLQLFKQGLAYRKEAEINWDPIDQTVLANEQVDAEGRSWRSGAIVEKKLLKQWFLGITKFEKQLNHDLNSLTNWPTKVKAMQKHWLGESHGTDIIFKLNGEHLNSVEIFTTRAETIFTVQFLALSLNHEITKYFSEKDSNLKQFLGKTFLEDSKEGYRINELYAINPITKEKIPVFVAPYVLDTYGHGAVMGCPAHDERDREFWLTLGNKHIKEPCYGMPLDNADLKSNGNSKSGEMNATTSEFQGMSFKSCRQEITSKLSTLGLGKTAVKYKLRDWLISRQRYWGTPIPIVHCSDCGPVPVPEDQLPILLPKVPTLTKKGNPLADVPEFVNTKCPSCGNAAKRETDTMDTFIDSSWYYFRFTDPTNAKLPFSKENVNRYMPVDLYIGGVEHAILHLLYSRFIAKALGTAGFWDGASVNYEPFKKLITQGMVHGKTYKDPNNGRFLKPDEIEIVENSKNSVIIKSTGEEPDVSFEKMSKSKYNGIDPTKFIAKHGPDATRAHILFQAPIENILNWDSQKIVGIERWLNKLINLTNQITALASFDEKFSTPDVLSGPNAKFHNEFQTLVHSITISFKDNISLNTVF